MRTFTVTVEGQRLLMHNGQLADPLNEFSKRLKEVTSKKKKGDDDHLLMSEIEFQGGLWWSEEHGPSIPGDAIEKMIRDGASKSRLGKQFEAGVIATEEWFALQYDGPRTRSGLWADKRFVDRRGARPRGQGRVMRTRPIFRNWKLAFGLQVLTSSINDAELRKAIVDAGTQVGLGDWHPRFGTFNVVSIAKAS